MKALCEIIVERAYYDKKEEIEGSENRQIVGDRHRRATRLMSKDFTKMDIHAFSDSQTERVFTFPRNPDKLTS